jgi:hypothetical protein
MNPHFQLVNKNQLDEMTFRSSLDSEENEDPNQVYKATKGYGPGPQLKQNRRR